jgi:hypothetical protein
MLGHVGDLEGIAIAALHPEGVRADVPLLQSPAKPRARLIGSRCSSTVAQWHVSGVYHHTVAGLEVVWLSFLIGFRGLGSLGDCKFIP